GDPAAARSRGNAVPRNGAHVPAPERADRRDRRLDVPLHRCPVHRHAFVVQCATRGLRCGRGRAGPWLPLLVGPHDPSIAGRPSGLLPVRGAVMGGPVIELQAVSKTYGDTLALTDVSWSVDPGQIVALLGPNGAGKTTAIALMAGIRRPSTGFVRIFGVDPRDRSVRARRAVMLQDCETIDFLTVLLTTHDLAEADELADRVLLVARGRVVQDASPAQLKRSARSAGSWIRFRPTASAPINVIRGVPGVLETRTEGDQLALLVDNPGEVVARLVGLQVPLTDLVVEGPSLEDAFVAMTYEDGA